MYICRKVTEETNGTYCVALDSKHFADLLMAQVAPPPTVASTNKVWMMMYILSLLFSIPPPLTDLILFLYLPRVPYTWIWS